MSKVAVAPMIERRACPACGSAPSAVLFDAAFAEPPIATYLEHFYRGRAAVDRLGDARYVIDECRACGVIYQRFVPDGDLLREIYEHWVVGSAEHADRPRDLRYLQHLSFEVEQLVAYFGLPYGETRVLDFGAGAGHWLDMASAFGCDTLAIELAAAPAAELLRRGHTVVPLGALATETVDYVNAEQVFEHLIDPRRALDELVRAMRRGGLIRLSVPDGGSIKQLLEEPDWSAGPSSGRSLNAVAPLEHVNAFDAGALRRFARSAGLRPFAYPLRQVLDSRQRARLAAKELKQAITGNRGTSQLFRKA